MVIVAPGDHQESNRYKTATISDRYRELFYPFAPVGLFIQVTENVGLDVKLQRLQLLECFGASLEKRLKVTKIRKIMLRQARSCDIHQ